MHIYLIFVIVIANYHRPTLCIYYTHNFPCDDCRFVCDANANSVL